MYASDEIVDTALYIL